ncbi:MAG: DUF4249 domain-containing protein [Bacteroidia bacterium]|nr:DUF4249 domain-containing protein [Bacteroidia bacterium]
MQKELKYLLLLLVFFVSCEQYYQPDIERIDGQLVVEARITNDLSRNLVHLTRTRSFNDKVPLTEVSGATVELVENKTNKIRGTESSPGFYVFNSVPVSGKNYFLRIGILNDIYESQEVTMPPIPTINNFISEYVIKKVYVNNVEGIPQPFDKPEREFYADMPVTNSLSYYRFDVKTVWEWHWDSIPNTHSSIPSAYGWYVYHEKESFNLAGPKNFSLAEKIEKHPLLAVSYNIYDYLYADTLFTKADTLYTKGCIIVVDQYGTSKESYEYHEKMNSQFLAVGSLFDPIQTQIYGNVICKTNASKIVFGYFDLNSYAQFRFYFNLWEPPGKVILRQIFRYPDIPDTKGMKRSQPIKGPPDEIPPPLPPPVWWEYL